MMFSKSKPMHCPAWVNDRRTTECLHRTTPARIWEAGPIICKQPVCQSWAAENWHKYLDSTFLLKLCNIWIGDFEFYRGCLAS